MANMAQSNGLNLQNMKNIGIHNFRDYMSPIRKALDSSDNDGSKQHSKRTGPVKIIRNDEEENRKQPINIQ